MHYETAITIAANTTEAAPSVTWLALANGLITDGEVEFPIGCFGLVHCRLEHHTFGALPTNRDGSFASDGHNIPIGGPIEFYAAPYDIKATCWNDDDTYAHTVTIRINMTSGKAMQTLISLVNGVRKFLALVGIRV